MADKPTVHVQAEDLLGASDAMNTLAQGSVDGLGAFLRPICQPVAEELGLWLKQRVSLWRKENVRAFAAKAQRRLEERAAQNAHAHPRLVCPIVEAASWNDDPAVQDLWAGLLASSCTEDGEDDSNLIFVNLLTQLTKAEARLMKHICESAKKSLDKTGLLYCESQVRIEFDQLCKIMGIDDLYRIDREIDHLNQLKLLSGAFQVDEGTTVWTAPTALALNMYVRCQGSRQSPVEFFDLTIPPPPGPRKAMPIRAGKPPFN